MLRASMLTRRSILQGSAALLTAGLALRTGQALPRPRRERLRIGSQTNTWGVPLKDYDHLLSVLDTLVRLGYQSFETNYRSLDHKAERAVECRRAFAKIGIEYLGPHLGAAFFEAEKIDAELQNLRRVASYSAEMGATYFILSGRRLPQRDGKLDLAAARRKAAAMNEAGRHCKSAGLTLCYHNHRHEFEGEPQEMSVLLKEIDPKLVWLNFDVGNPHVAGFDSAGFSAANFRRIRVYHIKDVKLSEGDKRSSTDLGAGDVNLKGVVAPLLDSEWEGWLVVEREGNYPHPASSPEEKLRQCREYLRTITGV